MMIYAFLLCLIVGALEIGSEAQLIEIVEGIERGEGYTIQPEETDPNNPLVDGIEPGSGYILLEEDDTPLQGRPSSNGCPNTAICSNKCQTRGYKWGMCTGPDKNVCTCWRHWGKR